MKSDNTNTDNFSLSSLGRLPKLRKTIGLTAYIPEDLCQYMRAWVRYVTDVRGADDTVSSIVSQAVCVWWNKARKKIARGQAVKLPDWQCAIKRSEYADSTEKVHYHLPQDVHKQIMTAIDNGHIYANWYKAKMAAIARIAVSQHYNDNHKYLLRYLKETKWDVDSTKGL